MSRDCKVGDTIYYLEMGSLRSEIKVGTVDEMLGDEGIRIKKESGNFIDSKYLLIASTSLYEVVHRGVDYATTSLAKEEAKWYINSMLRSFHRYMDAGNCGKPNPQPVPGLLEEIENLTNELNRLRQIALYIDMDVLGDKAIRDRIGHITHRLATCLALVPAAALLQLQEKLGMIASLKEDTNEHTN